ncbi:hypothetical protein K438DRAFT_1859996 [Mycena galopus ATCC 62051]|nr:hypothetical protein K438DRAFT_1859996 [Mycena galopus ATCC 62051]
MNAATAFAGSVEPPGRRGCTKMTQQHSDRVCKHERGIGASVSRTRDDDGHRSRPCPNTTCRARAFRRIYGCGLLRSLNIECMCVPRREKRRIPECA